MQVGALGSLGWSLLDQLHGEARAANGRGPRARSVILLWLWGGPSHLDTFDMKPAAPVEYRGPYRPIATSQPGTQICELLPSLARRADQYALLRSLHCESNDHGIAGTIGLTGSTAGATSLSGQVLPGQRQPTHGSVVSRVLGFADTMPRFVTVGGLLHQGKRRITGEDGGRLGKLHDALRVEYDPREGVKVPLLELRDGSTAETLERRAALRQRLNATGPAAVGASAFDDLDKYYQRAQALLTSPRAREVFELDREPAHVRERYGMFRFGQSCLLARRLIEADVRFVQVNWSSHVEPVEDTGDGGWDMHDRNFQQLQDRHAWMLDQASTALLDDLDQRGLLEETIVLALGEFGRTPKINAKAGRDHWNQCYSGLVAGGGFRGGQVIGQSDGRGEQPVDRPLTPADLQRTVLHQLGIDTTALTSAGLPLQGEVIEELAG